MKYEGKVSFIEQFVIVKMRQGRGTGLAGLRDSTVTEENMVSEGKYISRIEDGK